MNYTYTLKEILNNKSFNLTFNEKNSEKIANCTFSENHINCSCNKENLTNGINSDIKISRNPDAIELNETVSINFQKFESLTTYTIVAGKIVLGECIHSGYYQFKILYIRSITKLPRNISLEIKEGDNNKAICEVKDYETPYTLNCVMEGCSYNSINLTNKEIESNTELFYPNTFFYNGFNKRTLSIRGGKIEKGSCIYLNAGNYQYKYNISNNNIDNTDLQKAINFNLYTSFNSENSREINTSCEINLSGGDNTAHCTLNLDTCPDIGDDIYIKQNVTNDYTSDPIYSFFYFDFNNKTTTTIRTTNSSIIIKGKDNFILTDNIVNTNYPLDDSSDITNDIKISMNSKSGLIIKQQIGYMISYNYINENDIIYNSFNVKMIIKINGEEKDANCSIPKFKEKEKFNITCQASYSENDYIEILEEPRNDNYYFYGYKNKKILTLIAGSLYKEGVNNNKFDIINSKFSGECPLNNNYKFDLRIKYNNAIEDNISCSFNTGEISIDSIITINCTINDYEEIKSISILSNPNYVLLNKSITLYFNNFKNLNLYTITPGNLIKDKCQSNSFLFSLINTNISYSLSKEIPINISLIINDLITKEGTCQISKEMTNFNMSCAIKNYCPNNINIDIKIEIIQKSDINIISPNTLFINIPSEIQTSTLNLGYLEKSICFNLNYEFNIVDSDFSGKDLDIGEGQFKLKLTQFNKEANCSLDSLNIKCEISLETTEEEYCSNLYKDINVERFIGDNNNDNYIVINNDILHIYGAENLETFTIVAGELNQGTYNNKKYSFCFNNSIPYNNLSSSSNLEFSLQILNPIAMNASCLLPNTITKGNKFDINCEINGDINDYIVQTGVSEPSNIQYNTQYIGFHEFINKNTQVNLTAGNLKLGKNGNDNYYLNFTNSRIDYELKSDISFEIPVNINEIDKSITCYLYTNQKDIQCSIGNYANINIKHINITTEPSDNINSIQGKTLKFSAFKNKEINTLIAG